MFANLLIIISFLISITLGANSNTSDERNEPTYMSSNIMVEGGDAVPTISNPTPHARRQKDQNSETTDLAPYFNRGAYIRSQIENMIEDDNILKEAIEKSRTCANVWTTSAAITTCSILAISVIGATDYMDPRIANVIASCGAGLNGLFMWASMQYKKTERLQIDKQKKIREALGVPKRLILNDMSTSFEEFKGN